MAAENKCCIMSMNITTEPYARWDNLEDKANHPKHGKICVKQYIESNEYAS